MSSTILVKFFKAVGALDGSAIIAIAYKQKSSTVSPMRDSLSFIKFHFVLLSLSKVAY